MKLKDMYNELIELSKQLGITIRRENGSFRSGYAILKEQKIIIINKTIPVETAAGVIARALPNEILEQSYIKPVVREYIENEKNTKGSINEFNIVINY